METKYLKTLFGNFNNINKSLQIIQEFGKLTNLSKNFI